MKVRRINIPNGGEAAVGDIRDCISGPHKAHTPPCTDAYEDYVVVSSSPNHLSARGCAPGTTVWFLKNAEILGEVPTTPVITATVVPKSDYPHKHEVCGSPAFIGFMSIECTKCGKLGM